jgi:tetratricopeptide (TPR) repeat protein
MSVHLDRARVLIAQSRCDLAEDEIRKTLGEEPDDPFAHALLAVCMTERKAYAEATAEARLAVAKAPDHPFPHYVLAGILAERNLPEEAHAAIDEAIRLDPEDADYPARQAAIRLEQRRWEAALDSAERGLAIDPEHVDCTNLRAMALVKLGRKTEAGTAIESALARDPGNSATHANMGWTLLERGEREKAMEHFREALRLDPGSDWARRGIIEALKSRHLVYGLMLRWFLWMGKLSGSAQWAVIIGLYIGQRLLRGVAKSNPALAPWITPILVLYLVFAVMTWVAGPLFNLLLRLNRFGRLVLSREETVASNWIGLAILAALGCLGGWIATGSGTALLGAMVFGFLIPPLAGTFGCSPGWPRAVMALYTVGLAGVGLTALGLIVADRGDGLAGTLLTTYLVGAFLAQWVANGLMGVRPAR